MWTNTMTKRAMARGRLMSAVGAGSHSYVLPSPKTANTLHTKMNTKRVTAKGTMRAPRGPMLDSTCLFTVVIPNSHASCILPGTPAVARARTTRPSSTVTTPAAAVPHTVSRLSVRPPTVLTTWSPTETSASTWELRRLRARLIGSRTPRVVV